MPKFQDLSGQTFGKLTAISRAENDGRRTKWNCRCDCGNTVTVLSQSLISGNTRSCGCLLRIGETKGNWKHGLSKHPTYISWKCMIARCYNPENDNYANYGGKGICVCPEWREFQPFYDWSMQNGWAPGLTIDRLDNNKGYYPTNCRWADAHMQSNNRTTNHYLDIFGERITLEDAARKYNMTRNQLWFRLQKGMPPELAVTLPARQGRRPKEWLSLLDSTNST